MANEDSQGDVLLTRLADEFVARCRRGEQPSLQEYLDQHPELADDIRELFPALVEIEQVKQDRSEVQQSEARKLAEVLPLQQLGDYRILRVIGHGGMGVVYEAEQVSLGRHVALKVLPQALLLDARQKRRFEREARAAAKLHHTNIVPVFGVGEHEGLPYFAMQFIQGLGLDCVIEELRRLHPRGFASADTPASAEGAGRAARPEVSAAAVARSLLTGALHPAPNLTAPAPFAAAGNPPEAAAGPPLASASPVSDTSVMSSSSIVLPGQSGSSSAGRARKATYWQSVATIGVQVAEALEYAHKQGVLHRDIKPSNLLLDTAGTVWVTDFGLAKAEDQQNLTQTGDLLGTLRYLPPEAFEGKSDARSDVYSLGLTLYELLALRPAFDEHDRNRLVKQVTAAEPAPLERLNRSIPRDLVTVVHKAIDRDPAHRYRTAGELAADLRRFLADESIQARRPTGTERLLRWARHHPGVASSLAVIGLLLVALTVVSAVAAGRFQSIAREKSNLAEQNAALAKQREQERNDAEQARDAERWERYRANIAAAVSALQLNNINAARRALDASPKEHRNWEWRHLHSQLEGARLVLRGGKLPFAFWAAPPLSPSGKELAVWDEKGSVIRLWDLTTGKETAALRGQEGPARVLVYSPDGNHLASGSEDGAIRLWDVRTGQQFAVLRGHQGAVWWLAYSPDGQRIVSCDSRSSCRLWDAKGRQLADLGTGEGPPKAVFTPDSRRIVLGLGRKVSLVDASDGRQIAVLGSHEHSVFELVVSPDGKRIASQGDGEQDIRLWDAVNGKEVSVLRGHTARLRTFTFSPDGSRLASGGNYPDSSVRLWNAASGQLLKVLEGHKNMVRSVAFSPDGRQVVSASMDQTAWLWDAVAGRSIAPLRGHTGWLRYAFFSPDGKRVVTASDDQTLRLWDARSGELVIVLRGHRAEVEGAAFTPDGLVLVSRSADGELRVWDMELAERNGILRGHTRFVYDVAFSPDGEQVASAAWDGSVRLWDATTGRQTGLLDHDPDLRKDKYQIVGGVAWHPGGKLLASVSRADQIILWDLTTRKRRHVFAAPTGDSIGDTRAAFNPAGTLLAAASRDGRVRLWDVTTGKPAGVLQGHQDLCADVAFSPDGLQLASVGLDGTVRLWDVTTRGPIAVLRGPPAYRLAYSADGHLIAAAMGGTVRLWDAQAHRELDVLPHGGKVYGMAFSPDGTRLAVGCADNTIRLWDVATRKEVAELRGHPAYVHAVAFSSDGTRLVSASGDFTVRIWDTLSPTERVKGKLAFPHDAKK
jgi:WD40 repeat protein/serine/threonine protein kinase